MLCRRGIESTEHLSFPKGICSRVVSLATLSSTVAGVSAALPCLLLVPVSDWTCKALKCDGLIGGTAPQMRGTYLFSHINAAFQWFDLDVVYYQDAHRYSTTIFLANERFSAFLIVNRYTPPGRPLTFIRPSFSEVSSLNTILPVRSVRVSCFSSLAPSSSSTRLLRV